MEYIDYDGVAPVYDLYANTDYDFAFFQKNVTPGARVLELTCGTGRLSIPLIEAGARLTCVDLSQGMLDVLQAKLKAKGLEAHTLRADVQHLDLHGAFELAILPFQSFMELVGGEKQRNTLRAVYRALIPGGRFFCTMHNPVIRCKTVDGVIRGIGEFKTGQDTLVVTGFERGGDPVVHRSQFFERYDQSGVLVEKRLQSMQFELIQEENFRRMALEAGFNICCVYGDYNGNLYEANTSAVMVWELEKP